jgi:hypothetical protein
MRGFHSGDAAWFVPADLGDESFEELRLEKVKVAVAWSEFLGVW